MGIANYNKVNGLKAKASKTSLKDKSFESCLDFKSPQCPTCLAGPSLATPIRNHVLDEVIKYAVKLEQIQKSLMKQDTKNFHYDQRFNNSGAISPAPSVLSSGYGHSEESDHYQSCDSRSLNDTGDESTFKIQDFKVLVIGGDKTGKTELVETQLLNDAFYGTNPDTDTTICLENLVEANNYCDLSAKYMLQLIDSTNYEKDLDKVDGVALVYSVTNRYSLLEAHHYYCMIMEKKGINIPMVLIGLKSDADNRRVVCYNEGMVFAKELNLPFHEISSRQNVGLTEAFSSLIEVYDRMM
uniref:Ras family protein n=1 Tax=Rhabditophanes sp. KR3021 TaxID=114890 RepID=A0AC35U150_9BILA